MSWHFAGYYICACCHTIVLYIYVRAKIRITPPRSLVPFVNACAVWCDCSVIRMP